MARARVLPKAGGLRLCMFLLACPFAANAVDVDLKVEPGVALPLSAPQSQRFGVGGAGSAKLLLGADDGYR